MAHISNISNGQEETTHVKGKELLTIFALVPNWVSAIREEIHENTKLWALA